MTSYCEVCRGMYFSPHPHASLRHRSPSTPLGPPLPPPPPTRGTPPLSRRPAQYVDEYSESPFHGLTSSPPMRSGSVPGDLDAAPRRREGGRRRYVCPCQKRSVSEPIIRPHRDAHRDRGTQERKPRSSSATAALYQRDAWTPPPLPPSCWAGGQGYTGDTFNSQLRAEGCTSPFKFLRSGEGITGTRHPSRPPSRVTPQSSPTSFFFDSRYPPRELEEECCYPSLPRDRHSLLSAGQPQASHADLPSSSLPHDAERHMNGFACRHKDSAAAAAPRLCHGDPSLRHHPRRRASSHHLQRQQEELRSRHRQYGHQEPHATSASPLAERHVSPSVDQQQHHRRQQEYLPASSPMRPPPLLGAAAIATAQPSREETHPGQQRRMRQHGIQSNVRSEASMAASASATHQRPRPSSSRQKETDASCAHPAKSLGDLIARIRAEVSADAGAATAGETETSEAQSEMRASGVKRAHRAPGAATGKTKRNTSSLSRSTPASTAEEESHVDGVLAQPLPTRAWRGRHEGQPNSAQLPSSSHGSSRTSSSSSRTRSEGDEDKNVRRPEIGGTKSTSLQNPASRNAGAVRRSPSSQSKSASAPQTRSSLRHRRTRCTSSSSSSASSSSGCPSRESLSSSVQLQHALQEAQTMLQQMRQKATSSDGEMIKSSTRSRLAKKDDATTRSDIRPREASRHSKKMRSDAATVLCDDARPRASRRGSTPKTVDDNGGDSRAVQHIPKERGSRDHARSRRQERASPSHQLRSSEAARPSPAPSVQLMEEEKTARRPFSSDPAGAVAESQVRALSAAIEAKLERRQGEWCAQQDHRIERLREGLSSLCVAVRKDLRKMREEVEDARVQTGKAAAAHMVAEARRTAQPAALTEKQRAEAFPPECVLTWVAQCSPSDQRRLAHLLLPHLRPALTDVVEEEVERRLRTAIAEHHEQLRSAEERMRAYVDEAVTAAHRRRSLDCDDNGVPQSAQSGTPLWAGFSSVDAFNAHLRATARAVLVEEDDRRYSLANENERRHELRVRELQQHWHETLAEAQLTWKASWRAMLDKAGEGWARRTQAPLQQHADLLQTIVTALTRDVTHLQEQQNSHVASVLDTLQKEREMRQREQAKLAERVEEKVRQMLPRAVESACVRYHVQRERLTAAELNTTRVSQGNADGGGSSLSASPLMAEELRLSVVQPALDHMRRLLVSHQDMMNATVEDRCRRAESAVEGSRHVWLQNVTELRGKLSALRSDVRGAFNEMCNNLNVASPAL